MVTPASGANAPTRRGARGRQRRRVVLVAAGVLVIVVAVAGYLLTSGTFDDAVESPGVLVAAVDIAPGTVLTGAEFTVADVDLGGLPHIPFAPEAPFLFEGMVAEGPIPAGLPVLDAMFRSVQSAPLEDQLEVLVELDLSATPSEVFEGDTVLLVDPGLEPTAETGGRAASVLAALVLSQFDGTATRLFVQPEEWDFWANLPERIGAAPQVLPVPLGGDPEDMAARLDAVWAGEYEARIDALATVESLLAAESAEPVAGPGEFEVSVELDPALSAAPLAEGDLVLLIDPGVLPGTGAEGRPRQVLQAVELEVLAESSVRMFVPPEEWAYWTNLPETLGAAPLALPVADGSDTDAVAATLDALWLADYETALAEVQALDAELAQLLATSRATAGQLAVSLPIDASLSAEPLSEGDLVLLIDPGRSPTAENEGRPRSVMQTLRLSGYDGLAVRLFVPPVEWLRWRALPDELGAAPMALPVPEGTDLDAMIAELNAGWQAAHDAALGALGALPAGQLWVSLPVQLAQSAAPPREGDIVLLVDPGRPPIFDPEGLPVDEGIPPTVMEWRALEGWDGLSLNFWASPERYAYYTLLVSRLEGRIPIALPVVRGDLTDGGLDNLATTLNRAYRQWWQ